MSKILIACEESQAVCIAFRELGYEAYSCDLQDCSGGHPEWHIKGDAIEQAYSGEYDLMIAHPPCTYMANSGVRWLDIVDGKITNEKRLQQMLWAGQFFRSLLSAPIPFIAIENPIPHKYAGVPKYCQIIQPWQFGHKETKATCLWLKNLPLLKETSNVKKWMDLEPDYIKHRIHRMPPGPERAKLRSKTFPGIAMAMAEQWGPIIEQRQIS